MRKKLFLLITVIGIGFYSCDDKSSYNEITLYDKIIKKTNTNNKYFYFNIWNTSCIPCIKEMPEIDSLAFVYKDKVDFIFMTDESEEKIERFFKVKNIQVNHSIFMNDEKNTISYLSEKIAKKHLSYPTHIIMNDKFEVIHHHIGGGTMNINGRDVFDPVLTGALKKLK